MVFGSIMIYDGGGNDKKENVLLYAVPYERDACVLRGALGRKKCKRALVADRCSGDCIFDRHAVFCWQEPFIQAAHLPEV